MMERPIFKCKNCSSQKLKIVCEYKLIERFEETMSCNCELRDELAAYRRYCETTHCRESGWIDGGHRFSFSSFEEIDEAESEVEEFEIYCYDCYEKKEGGRND